MGTGRRRDHRRGRRPGHRPASAVAGRADLVDRHPDEQALAPHHGTAVVVPVGMLAADAPAGSPTMTTSRVRGPWTPSTRLSSMSEVAEGPETKVMGRRSRVAWSRAATASGTEPTIWVASTTQ